MALSAVGPLAHMSFLHGLGPAGKFMKPLVPMMASYIAGLYFYAHHYPEVRWPGVRLVPSFLFDRERVGLIGSLSVVEV